MIDFDQIEKNIAAEHKTQSAIIMGKIRSLQEYPKEFAAFEYLLAVDRHVLYRLFQHVHYDNSSEHHLMHFLYKLLTYHMDKHQEYTLIWEKPSRDSAGLTLQDSDGYHIYELCDKASEDARPVVVCDPYTRDPLTIDHIKEAVGFLYHHIAMMDKFERSYDIEHHLWSPSFNDYSVKEDK